VIGCNNMQPSVYAVVAVVERASVCLRNCVLTEDVQQIIYSGIRDSMACRHIYRDLKNTVRRRRTARPVDSAGSLVCPPHPHVLHSASNSNLILTTWHASKPSPCRQRVHAGRLSSAPGDDLLNAAFSNVPSLGSVTCGCPLPCHFDPCHLPVAPFRCFD
jgi:hypothetical protein